MEAIKYIWNSRTQEAGARELLWVLGQPELLTEILLYSKGYKISRKHSTPTEVARKLRTS